MKRKRRLIDICNFSSLQKSILKAESELGFPIPPLLLFVIIQNGALESILQVLARNHIEVIVMNQHESGSVIHRKICVRRKSDRQLIMHAESRIMTKHLPSALLHGIIEREKGIGSLIEILRIETYRHIRILGFNRRQRALYRIYDIYIREKRAITIKENFPIDLPTWNL